MLRTPFFTKCRPIFWKYAPRPRWEAWFWKRHKCRFMKNMLLGPPNSARMPPFCTIYCSLKFAKSIGKMCIFCLWPLLGSYIYHRLLYHKASRWDFRIFASLLASFSEKMLAALGGKHDFESGMKARSWKMCLLGPTNDPICTRFASSFAVWNLQNPLEKCVFLVYGSFSEAIFSIVCFIAWLRSEIFIFLHRIWPHFVEKCSPHSVLQKRKLMQHMFR